MYQKKRLFTALIKQLIAKTAAMAPAALFEYHPVDTIEVTH